MRKEILPFERIRNLRIDRDLTQQQIAKLLYISQNTYCQYEIGTLQYPIPVLLTLADFYDTSVDYLLGRTDEKKAYPKGKYK